MLTFACDNVRMWDVVVIVVCVYIFYTEMQDYVHGVMD
jgi:hypothetical protein